MKIQESAENYLETILILKEQKGIVRSIDIVNNLNFSKASVSVAMKKLREAGYIEVNASGEISLSETGLSVAEKIYERHKILTDCLIKLGVDEKIASEDACRIEHIISNESFEKIKYYFKKNHISE